MARALSYASSPIALEPRHSGRSAAGTRLQTGSIRAEIVSAERYRALGPAFADLATRAAEPNAYMDPLMIAAVAQGARATDVPIVLAWDGDALMGVWVLRRGHPRCGLPVPCLLTPINAALPDSTPVVDAARADVVLAAILDTIEHDPAWPKLIGIELMNNGGPVMAAFTAAMAARGSAPVMLEHSQRPKLVCDTDPDTYFAAAMSGSHRRKLGQLRRRLAGRGALALTVHTEEAACAAAIERFITLEAAGWKGRLGNPLRDNPEQIILARQAIPALAANKRAEIWEMSLNGEAVSMAVILRSGSRVYDWKITYSEAQADCSPGVLLAQDYTAAFLRDSAVTIGDSCAYNDAGLLGPLWTGRQSMANLMIDCRSGGSALLTICGGAEHAYRSARRLAKGPARAIKNYLRHSLRPSRPRSG